MSTMHRLTLGSLEKIMKGMEVDEPILQILSYVKLSGVTVNENGTIRSDEYSIMVSDGRNINRHAMLATRLNHLMENNILTTYAICKVSNYHLSLTNSGGKENYLVMIITGIEVVVPGIEVGYKIGNPIAIDSKIESEGNSTTSDTSTGQTTELLN